MKRTSFLAQSQGFESKAEYYDYVIGSRITGQHNQARELFNAIVNYDMDGQELARFYAYVEEVYSLEYLTELKEYFRKNQPNIVTFD
jgi:hypothetical protein